MQVSKWSLSLPVTSLPTSGPWQAIAQPQGVYYVSIPTYIQHIQTQSPPQSPHSMEPSEIGFRHGYAEDVGGVSLDDSDVDMDLDTSACEGMSEVGYLEEKYGPSLVLL